MECDFINRVCAELVMFVEREEGFLRIVAPSISGFAGKPMWYEMYEKGWEALGVDDFREHEAAYQRAKELQ